MKRGSEATDSTEEPKRNRRKSIKLIDFTTPDKDDEAENNHLPTIQQPDFLLLPNTTPIQDQLHSTKDELASLKTLYDEQQLIVTTYRRKEQTTIETIDHLKREIFNLNANLTQCHSENEKYRVKYNHDKSQLLLKHSTQLKALNDQIKLLNQEVNRNEQRAQLAESQLKEAKHICTELMSFFKQEDDDLLVNNSLLYFLIVTIKIYKSNARDHLLFFKLLFH